MMTLSLILLADVAFAAFGACALLVLFFRAVIKQDWIIFFTFAAIFVAVLNARFFLLSMGDSMSLVVSIADVTNNFGVNGDFQGLRALTTCVDNNCTALPFYTFHASWAVSLYERYALASTQTRTMLIYTHIICQSVGFVLSLLLLKWDGLGHHSKYHAGLGYVAVILVAFGLLSACELASDHDDVPNYGGMYSRLGFWMMAIETFTPMVLGIKARQFGDIEGHRRWMIRYVGSMFGAFAIFRYVIHLTGPLLRQYNGASHLLAIWVCCPLGILIADLCYIAHERGTKAVKSHRE